MSGPAKAEVARSAEAGHWGKEVRSDLHVALELRAEGGIEIGLESRVAAYYGENILAQARQVLAELGVRDARLTIHDEGALPFVIAARIEAAVRRGGLGQDRRALPEQVPLPPPVARDRLRRSRLYLPGSEPKYFINAVLHARDAVILDLEDSVHPAEKDAARVLARNALRAVDFAGAERTVRINQLPLGLADLEEVIPEQSDMVLIPKSGQAERAVEGDGKVVEPTEGPRLSRPVLLMPVLGSALGLVSAFAVATASPNLAAVTIGLEDYTADLGVVKTSEGAESLY